MSKGSKASLIIISLSVLLLAALMSGTIQSDRWKISELDINAKFKRVSSEQIRLAIAASEERSFFKVNIEEIQNNLRQIPWVQSVNVMKKWPDTLIVKLIEHKAVAVWNNEQLLNEQGDIFSVNSTDDLQSLPKIQGVDGQAVEILNKFTRFNELLAMTGQDILEAEVSPRGGWIIQLSNGTQLDLGTEQKDSRLIRLVETWVQLSRQRDHLPQYIDLRYTNGYAVKWNEDSAAQDDETQANMSDSING